MDDLIIGSAKAYRELMNYQYVFLCGRKGKQIEVKLSFPENAYHHLAGFQYSGLATLVNRKEALKIIESGIVQKDSLVSSGYTHFDRLKGIVRLKDIIENNKFIFQYIEKLIPYTKIKADYFITSDNYYFFIRNEKPESIFDKIHNICYEHGSPQYTILTISRITKSNGTTEEIYRSKHYKTE